MTGEELKALRKQLGLSQTELGEQLGITASAVSRLETNDNVMSKPVAMLAEKLAESGDSQ